MNSLSTNLLIKNLLVKRVNFLLPLGEVERMAHYFMTNGPHLTSLQFREDNEDDAQRVNSKREDEDYYDPMMAANPMFPMAYYPMPYMGDPMLGAPRPYQSHFLNHNPMMSMYPHHLPTSPYLQSPLLGAHQPSPLLQEIHNHLTQLKSSIPQVGLPKVQTHVKPHKV